MSWTREQIDNILKSNDLAVERAIIRLFEAQTETEQKTAGTHHKKTAATSLKQIRGILSIFRDSLNFLKYCRFCIGYVSNIMTSITQA